jgi:hypothetical protein
MNGMTCRRMSHGAEVLVPGTGPLLPGLGANCINLLVVRRTLVILCLISAAERSVQLVVQLITCACACNLTAATNMS